MVALLTSGSGTEKSLRNSLRKAKSEEVGRAPRSL